MDDSSKRQAIIDKVRKLAAITNPDANAFQGEMENAAKLISRLMDEYTITWGEVRATEAQSQADEVRNQFISMQAENYISGIMQWHWELAHLISKVTHTKDYGRTDKKATKGHMVFFGPDTNAHVATALFVEWTGIIERMAVNAYSSKFKALRRKYGRGDGMMDRVPPEEKLTHFKPSFIQGIVDGMAKVVRDNERARSAENSRALMVISTELSRRYAEMSAGFRDAKARRPAHFNEAAYRAGRSIGENIDISLKRVNQTSRRSDELKQLKG